MIDNAEELNEVIKRQLLSFGITDEVKFEDDAIRLQVLTVLGSKGLTRVSLDENGLQFFFEDKKEQNDETAN